MTRSTKVLILTAPFGSGHLQVSSALTEEFMKHENVIVEEYDLYSEEFPTLSKTLQKAYLKTYKPIGKDLYRMLYYGSSYAIHDSIHAKILKPYLEFGIRSLRNKINSFKPDAIISVFPVTSLYTLEEKGFKIPIYTVITDYYASGLWLYKGARRHYVASNKMVAWGVANGLSQNQFMLTGIPINSKFYKKHPKSEIYEKYQLDPNKRTVVVSAGAYGVVSHVDEIATRLASQPEIQVVVVCGNNHKMYEKMMEVKAGYANLQVLGYCKEMNELLDIADLMVTKPGGISLTEAAVKSVPVILYNPVYGQELENARYFEEKGASVIVSSESELIYHVLIILNEEGMLEEMKQNINQLSRPYSAKNIVKDVLKDSEEYYEQQVL
ncbi:MGDG synthase family glycosyltransferase [Turicibacter sanguinis]|uniref:MGDG synthase family glycosyltransferase n=1 Tax=Turicibacter sanguinis TaxID=154288 RepID=UPI001896E967|nr:glycosyltransferase [Turicibacter sanguinis]